MESLTSNQEEADSRIILNCIYAARKGARKIIVQSPDTDDLILFVHHWPAIKAKEIYFMKAVQGKHINLKRFIPVHDLYQKLSQEQHNILLLVYCLSGCDTTTSSFVGMGRRKHSM